MKLKYIFMLLGVMLLGLTACGKKDTPEPSNKNPFAGTKWETSALLQMTEARQKPP